MKHWNWKKIKYTAAVIMVALVAVGAAVTLLDVTIFGVLIPGIKHDKEWQAYQIEHKCKLAADAMSDDPLMRQVRNDNGPIRAVFIRSFGAKAYVCDDNVIYIDHQ